MNLTEGTEHNASTQTEEKHSKKKIIVCKNVQKSGEFAPRSKLPREIWRWLLGFSLKGKTKNVRRDFSNGYVIAEVLHQYFPMDIQLPEFRNGESFPIKMANWQQLDIFFKKQSSTTSIDCRLFTKWLLRIIDGTIHEKQGAAELLIIWLYESLTGKTVKQIEGEFSESFSDQRYQIQLPLYARNTASYALKTNVRVTEEIRYPNLNTNKRTNERILKRHQRQKEMEKSRFPNRFEIVPTLAELCSKHLKSKL